MYILIKPRFYEVTFPSNLSVLKWNVFTSFTCIFPHFEENAFFEEDSGIQN